MSPTDEFIARQLYFLQRSGLDRAQAQARLQQEMPDSSAVIVAAGRSDPFSRLLQESAEEFGPHLEAVEQAAHEFRSEAVNAFRPVWRSLLGTAVYAAVVTVVAAVLVGLSTTFTAVHSVYESFGADLPRFTQVIVATLYRNLLIWTMVAGVVALLWVLRSLRRGASLGQRGAGSVFLHLTVQLGLRDYWLVLLLVLMRAACRSGMAADAALDAAQRAVARWTGLARLVAGPVTALRKPLLTAARLGTLDAELAFLIEERWQTMPQRAAARAEYFSLLVNVLVAAAIGTLVIAIYLPIFKLAAIVG